MISFSNKSDLLKLSIVMIQIYFKTVFVFVQTEINLEGQMKMFPGATALETPGQTRVQS